MGDKAVKRLFLFAFAADSFRGRETGTPDADRAAAWISRRLAVLGVEVQHWNRFGHGPGPLPGLTGWSSLVSWLKSTDQVAPALGGTSIVLSSLDTGRLSDACASCKLPRP